MDVGPAGSQGAGHRALPHTADVILQARAPTGEQCLAEAVAALTERYADVAQATSVRRHAVHIDAVTDEQALVDLLEETLDLLDAHGEVPLGTHLDAAGPGRLTGWLEVTDVGQVELAGSIPKGIARSGLSLTRIGGTWRCTVVVDV